MSSQVSPLYLSIPTEYLPLQSHRSILVYLSVCPTTEQRTVSLVRMESYGKTQWHLVQLPVLTEGKALRWGRKPHETIWKEKPTRPKFGEDKR